MPNPTTNTMGHTEADDLSWCTIGPTMDSNIMATLSPLKNKTFTPPTTKRRAGTAWHVPADWFYATTLSVSI